MFNLLVRAVSLLSLFLVSPQPFQPHSAHFQEERFPQQCLWQAEIWTVFTKHTSKQDVGGKDGNCSILKKREYLASERCLLKRWALPQNIRNISLLMDCFSSRHKVEFHIIFHYWATVIEIWGICFNHILFFYFVISDGHINSIINIHAVIPDFFY